VIDRRARHLPARGAILFVILGLTAGGFRVPAPAGAQDVVQDVARLIALPVEETPAVTGHWVRLAPPGPAPPARMGGLAAWDARRDALLVFAGWDGEAMADLWRLPLAAGARWERLRSAQAAPDPRLEVAGAFDAGRGRLVSFGGKDDVRFMNDVWTYGHGPRARWTRVRPQNAPPSPRESRAVLDTRRDRLILACGFGETGSGRGHLAEVWSLWFGPRMRWERIEPAGKPLPPRRGHSAVYDSRRDRVLVFGGLNDWGFYDDLWSLSLGASPRWTRVETRGAPPPKRYGHVAAFDERGDRMIVYGGYNGRFLEDAWVLDLSQTPTWVRVNVPEPRPAPRDFPLAAWDGARERLLVFGGNQGERVHGDLWSLEVRPTGPIARHGTGGTPGNGRSR
jgi:hypothetical protein